MTRKSQRINYRRRNKTVHQVTATLLTRRLHSRSNLDNTRAHKSCCVIKYHTPHLLLLQWDKILSTQERKCTYHVKVALSRYHCCGGNTTQHSASVMELYVTVNYIKILLQKQWFYCKFASLATINIKKVLMLLTSNKSIFNLPYISVNTTYKFEFTATCFDLTSHLQAYLRTLTSYNLPVRIWDPKCAQADCN
jgi:hypothetical protein